MKNYFTPLRIHSKDDQEVFSTVDFKDLSEKAQILGYRRLAIVNSAGTTGFPEAVSVLKKFDLSLSVHFTLNWNNYTYEIYLYPFNESGYRKAVELTNTSMFNLKDILADEGCVKIIPMTNDLNATECVNNLVKKDFFWGIEKDFLSASKDMIESILSTKEKLVAFPKVLFLNDSESFDIYTCVRNSCPYYLPGRINNNLHARLLSKEEYVSIYESLPESILNSFVIGKRCARYVLLKKDLNLNFFKEGRQKLVKGFVRECFKGLGDLGLHLSDKHLRRLLYEIRIILLKRFENYFLLIKDVSNFCRNNDIMIGPRGSAAGALVSYALRVTDIDPIKYKLVFERFLNPDRQDLPDYDLDLPSNKRNLVIAYLQNRWHDDFMLAHILTKTHLQARNALRSVGKVMGLSSFEINSLVGYIKFISTKKVDLKSTLEDDNELKELLNNDAKKDLVYKMATRLEGQVTGYGIHAAGIVLVPNEDLTLIGYYDQGKDQIPLLQHNMLDSEYLGLIKFDLLGVDALAILDVILVKKSLRLEDIPKDDKLTFAHLQISSTIGLFQISYLNSEILKLVKVSSVSDIADVIGLNRPGSMDYIEDFIKRKTGKVNFKSDLLEEHKDIQEILLPTEGIFIWQEQIMELAMKVAGYSGTEADHLRKIIGKKIFDLMPQQKEKFITGATPKVGLEKAKQLYNIIENFKGYGFNKSHGIAYAFNTYYMAYFKCNDPAIYYWALLNQEKDQLKKAKILQVAYSEGIKILPPHLSLSQGQFTIEEGSIRFGLHALNFFSTALEAKIIRHRKHTFLNLEDFLDTVPLSNSEVATVRDLFNNDLSLTDSVEKQYKFMKLVWSDLKISPNNCLRYWVFNHVLQSTDYLPQFNVRILKWSKVKNASDRDNLRVPVQSDSYLLEFSDGTYTLKLIVNNPNVINAINSYYKSKLIRCFLILRFNGTIKKLIVEDVLFQ